YSNQRPIREEKIPGSKFIATSYEGKSDTRGGAFQNLSLYLHHGAVGWPQMNFNVIPRPVTQLFDGRRLRVALNQNAVRRNNCRQVCPQPVGERFGTRIGLRL